MYVFSLIASELLVVCFIVFLFFSRENERESAKEKVIGGWPDDQPL